MIFWDLTHEFCMLGVGHTGSHTPIELNNTVLPTNHESGPSTIIRLKKKVGYFSLPSGFQMKAKTPSSRRWGS